jgi:pimeloyl-ACP methyl ester carboxylesterase
MSDKPPHGYGFDEVAADLNALLNGLGINVPVVLAGQSWGGSVVLDFAVRYPHRILGLALVDGGYLSLSPRPDATWEQCSRDLRPPNLLGTPRTTLAEWIRNEHPDWTDEGIEATLNNFETLADGTVRPWLSLDRHMEILRALWEHQPTALFPEVKTPSVIAAATRPGDTWIDLKREGITAATSALPRSRVVWFENTSHDIHVHRPDKLADLMLGALGDGFFRT